MSSNAPQFHTLMCTSVDICYHHRLKMSETVAIFKLISPSNSVPGSILNGLVNFFRLQIEICSFVSSERFGYQYKLVQ